MLVGISRGHGVPSSFSFRSVRINFQYAVDVLCGSLNRACDVKKLFQYIGMKNTQSPIKIDFVFVNGTYYDAELRRTFYPSEAKLFACDQAVILPHVSRQKCTCMDCNAMCPKMKAVAAVASIARNSSLIDRVKFRVSHLHLTTKLAIGIYVLFVILFISVNTCLYLCNMNSAAKKNSYLTKSK